MNKGFECKQVLFINYIDMPDHIAKIICDMESFHNDCYLNWGSDMEPAYNSNEDWSNSCTLANMEKYWKEQRESNGDYCKSETLEQFIKDYGLEVEKWIIDSGADLRGVQKVLIKICW